VRSGRRRDHAGPHQCWLKPCNVADTVVTTNRRAQRRGAPGQAGIVAPDRSARRTGNTDADHTTAPPSARSGPASANPAGGKSPYSARPPPSAEPVAIRSRERRDDEAFLCSADPLGDGSGCRTSAATSRHRIRQEAAVGKRQGDDHQDGICQKHQHQHVEAAQHKNQMPLGHDNVRRNKGRLFIILISSSGLVFIPCSRRFWQSAYTVYNTRVAANSRGAARAMPPVDGEVW